MTNEHNSISESVLARIKKGEVSMRPRAYFILGTIVLMVTLIAIVLVSTFLVNFALFAFQIEGHQSLLAFGLRGIATFLLVFPWEWVAADLILIVLATLLIRRFRSGYHRPWLYVGGSVFLFVLIAGIVVESVTPLNDMLLHDADRNELPPPFSSLYEGVHGGPPHDLGVFRGIVDSVATSTFTVSHDDFDHDHDDGNFIVVPPHGFDLTVITVGEYVYIAGNPNGNTITAYGIQIIQAPPGS